MYWTIIDFIEENWPAFCRRCGDRGQDPEEVLQLLKDLNNEE